MRVIRHARVASRRRILFGRSSTPTNDSSLQIVTSMQRFTHHRLRQASEYRSILNNKDDCPYSKCVQTQVRMYKSVDGRWLELAVRAGLIDSAHSVKDLECIGGHAWDV